MDSDTLATSLGWFSIGLGALETVVPSAVTAITGTTQNTLLLQGLGAREIASGVGILTQEKKKPWLWSRVAGDAMDLLLLATALRARQNDKAKVAFAIAMVAGVTVLDVIAGLTANA